MFWGRFGGIGRQFDEHFVQGERCELRAICRARRANVTRCAPLGCSLPGRGFSLPYVLLASGCEASNAGKRYENHCKRGLRATLPQPVVLFGAFDSRHKLLDGRAFSLAIHERPDRAIVECSEVQSSPRRQDFLQLRSHGR